MIYMHLNGLPFKLTGNYMQYLVVYRSTVILLFDNHKIHAKILNFPDPKTDARCDLDVLIRTCIEASFRICAGAATNAMLIQIRKLRFSCCHRAASATVIALFRTIKHQYS